MADVFISFADDEKEVALAVKDLLCQNVGSMSVFASADYGQLSGGERWLDRIEAELRSAKVALLLLSSRSVARPWVNFEAGAAWMNRSVLIPVCFGGLMANTLPRPYGDFQAVQLDTVGYEQLYLLMRSVSIAIGEHVPPPPIVQDTPETIALRRVMAGIADKQAALAVQSAQVRLSEAAHDLLMEAARSATGEIATYYMDLGFVVQVNGKSYEAKLNEPRKRAALEDALAELERADLIVSTDSRRTTFRVTRAGYERAG